jgi:hypothetical protein
MQVPVMNGYLLVLREEHAYNYRRKENNEMIDLLGGNSVKI